MTKRALLIGINYASIPDITLNGCVEDIINMRNVLIDAYDYQPSNIVLLRDDNSDPMFQPTLIHIMTQLKLLAAQSTPQDEIWFHYSGHGSLIQKLNDTDPNSVDNILVPVDYPDNGFIREVELLAIIHTIKCRAIFLFDCCHSGSMCDLPWSIQYNSPTSYSTIKNNTNIVANPNIYIFSGCKDNQTSADTYSALEGESVGAFTNAFIESLRKSRHNTSLLLLYREICMNLANNGYTQVPVLSLSKVPASFILTRATPTSIMPVKQAIKPTLNLTNPPSIRKSMNLILG